MARSYTLHRYTAVWQRSPLRYNALHNGARAREFQEFLAKEGREEDDKHRGNARQGHPYYTNQEHPQRSQVAVFLFRVSRARSEVYLVLCDFGLPLKKFMVVHSTADYLA